MVPKHLKPHCRRMVPKVRRKTKRAHRKLERSWRRMQALHEQGADSLTRMREQLVNFKLISRLRVYYATVSVNYAHI